MWARHWRARADGSEERYAWWIKNPSVLISNWRRKTWRINPISWWLSWIRNLPISPYRKGLIYRTEIVCDLRVWLSTTNRSPPRCVPPPAQWCGPDSTRHFTKMFDNTNLAWIEDMSTDPKTLPTIGHMLRDLGYYTAYKGKWHESEFQEGDTKDALEPYGFSDFQDWGEVQGGPLDGFTKDPKVADEAIGWLNSRASESGESQPWFLAVNFVNPHDVMYFDTDDEEMVQVRGMFPIFSAPDTPLYQQRVANRVAGIVFRRSFSPSSSGPELQGRIWRDVRQDSVGTGGHVAQPHQLLHQLHDWCRSAHWRSARCTRCERSGWEYDHPIYLRPWWDGWRASSATEGQCGLQRNGECTICCRRSTPTWRGEDGSRGFSPRSGAYNFGVCRSFREWEAAALPVP